MEITISDLQAQLEDIKERLRKVEHKTEHKAAVGPRGPMGPPGLITKGDQGESGRNGSDGVDGRDGRNGITPGKDEVETAVLTLLIEYHVLDEETGLPFSGPYAKK